MYEITIRVPYDTPIHVIEHSVRDLGGEVVAYRQADPTATAADKPMFDVFATCPSREDRAS